MESAWMHGRRGVLAVAIAIACFALPSLALAAFPGSDPDENPRVNTPNDPGFDNCEGDDEQGGPTCSYFDESFVFFGFSPDTALVAPPAPLHPEYNDCTFPLPG